MKKRLLSLLLVLTMVLSLVPAMGITAFAANTKTFTVEGKGDYDTLQQAVDACDAGVQTTITLNLDYSSPAVETTIPADKDIILDLDGNIITYNGKSFDKFTANFGLINNKGTLTVRDSQDKNCDGTGGGGIYFYPEGADRKPNPTYYVNLFCNWKNLNIESGEYVSLGEGAASYVIDNFTSSGDNPTARISGGYLHTLNFSVAIRLNLNGSSTTNVNRCYITGGIVSSIWSQHYGDNNACVLHIKDAIIENNVGLSTSPASAGVNRNNDFEFENVIFGTDVNIAVDAANKFSLAEGYNNKLVIKNIKARSFSINADGNMKVLDDGYFMSAVSSDCIKEGFYCITNPDKDVKNLDGVTYNYKIGNTYEDISSVRIIHADGTSKDYETLADAAKNVKSGETVQLLRDVTGEFDGPENAELIFDLNGHTLDGCLVNYGKMTVDDSSAAGTGKICNKTYGNGCLYNYGYGNSGYLKNVVLTVNGGTFEGKLRCIESYYTYPTYNCQIIINGGDFSVPDTGDDVEAVFASAVYQSNLVINGGTFSGKTMCDEIYYTTDYYHEYSKTTINDGTFNTPFENTGMQYEINGGTFNQHMYLFPLNASEINGGTFNDVLEIYPYYGINITDGTFNDYVFIKGCYYDGKYCSGKLDAAISGGKFGGNNDSVGSAYVYSNWNGGWNFNDCLTGGIYTVEPDEEMVADGYIVTSNLNKNTKAKYPYEVKPLQVDVEESVDTNGKITADGTYQSGHYVYGEGWVYEDTDMSIEGTQASGGTVSDNAGIKEVRDTMDNSEVLLYTETNIQSATSTQQNAIKDAMKETAVKFIEDLAGASEEPAGGDTFASEENKQASKTAAQTLIDQSSEIEKKVNVEFTAAAVDQYQVMEEESTVTHVTVESMTYDVKPVAKITIAYEVTEMQEKEQINPDSGESETVIVPVTTTKYEEIKATIPNSAIKSPISFRLPIGKYVRASSVAIYHNSKNPKEPGNGIGDLMGVYEIHGDYGTANRYVELASSTFSFFTYQVMNGVSEYSVAAIMDNNGKFYGYDTLKDAIDAYADPDGTEGDAVGTKLILLKDVAAGKTYQEDDPHTTENETIKETNSFDFNNQTINLDLNGYKLTGTSTQAAGVTVSNADIAHQTTLGLVGVYKNDVSAYVMDGYYYKTSNPTVGDAENNEVYQNTNDVYFVELIATTETDRDSSNNNGTRHTDNLVDVYADDTVSVDVKVNGSNFTSADVTVSWDTSLFEATTKMKGMPAGWRQIKDENDNVVAYRFTSPKNDDTYFAPGTVLGTLTFKAKFVSEDALAENALCTFKLGEVSGKSYTNPVKVIGSWGVTAEDSTTAPLDISHLQNDSAKVLLMDSMTGAVEASEGLVYKGTVLQLPLLDETYNNNKGWSAKVGGSELASATIEYCVLTSEEVAASTEPGSAGHEYSSTFPTAQDADTYTVYYRIKANGYQTVTGSREVTIDKQKVTLTWSGPSGFASEGGSVTSANVKFVGEYSESGFAAPTATFENLNKTQETLNGEKIALTAYPISTTLKDVGEYTFTAVDNKNYEFTNPSCVVKVTGMDINGWQLTATGSTDDDATNGVKWRDGESYAIGELVIADTANLAKVDATITYEYFIGTYYEEGDTIPEGKEVGDEIWITTEDPSAVKFSELGVRKLRMTVTAPNYETLEQEVTFTIKNPIFKVETTEYVAGYSLVLVYTNEDNVSFKYDTTQMYDVTDFGYRYNNITPYANVFATVVKGVAADSKVYANNNPALTLTLPTEWSNDVEAFRLDVNNKSEAAVDLDDITAVHSIYNVNATNILDMELVLRCDVNRDKKVDTTGDVSAVLAYYLEHSQN